MNMCVHACVCVCVRDLCQYALNLYYNKQFKECVNLKKV